MTTISAGSAGELAAGLPPLREVPVEAVDPQTVALRLGGSLRLFIDVRQGEGNPEGYPDGLAVALAPRRNGLTHVEIGAHWLEQRQTLPPGQVGPAAVRFYDGHYDIDAGKRIDVPHAEPGESLGSYGDRLAGSVLRRQFPHDTDLELHSLNEVDAPGTRFSHLFPADNNMVLLGWLARGRLDMAMRAFENSQYQIKRFGYDPNINVKIAMLRTQSPFDAYALDAMSSPELYGLDVVRHFRGTQIRNLEFWNSGRAQLVGLPPGKGGAIRRVAKLPTGEIGYRNWDDSIVNYKTQEGLRPESAEEDYRTGERLLRSMNGASEEERATAWEKMVRSILASCESKQDISDYQLEDPLRLETIRTTDILPSWLQANMAQKYKMVALGYEAEGDFGEAEKYWRGFNLMKELLNNRHYRDIDETHAHYTDITTEGEQLTTLNAAQILPLLVGDIVPYDRAVKVANTWRDVLLGDNGLNTSPNADCDEQWSGRRNWPSLATWAVLALMQAASDAKKQGADPQPFVELAADIRAAGRKGMQSWFDANGTIPERINDTEPTKAAVGGEYCKDPETVQHGFGMSIGSIRVWEAVDPLQADLDPRLGSAISQIFAQTVGGTAVSAGMN